MWPRNEGSSTPFTSSVVGAARLRELAGDTADLHDGQRRAERQHRRHLQQHLQLLADRSAPSTSRNDSTQSPAWSRNARPSATSPSDASSERASPAKTSGGQRAQALAHRVERRRVGPGGLLRGADARATMAGAQVRLGDGHAIESSLRFRSGTAYPEVAMAFRLETRLWWRRRRGGSLRAA